MRFYRFELTFCGEKQGVGLFHGLADAIPAEADYLIDSLFSSLAIPKISDGAYDSVCCWFTVDGLERFIPAMEIVMQSLKEAGWGMCAAVIEDDANKAVYIDKDQAVFTWEYLGGCYELIDIEQIKDAKKLLPNG